MQLPQAIIFDLDDTIIDDSRAVAACWEQTCREATARIEGLNEASFLQPSIASVTGSGPIRHDTAKDDLT